MSASQVQSNKNNKKKLMPIALKLLSVSCAVGLNWEDYVTTSDKYSRPNEVNHLVGDSSKAKKELKWAPETSFKDLVQIMVENDLAIAEQEKVLIKKNLLNPTWENPII